MWKENLVKIHFGRFRWFNLTNFLGTCIHRSQWCKGSPERLGRALASFSYDVFSVKLKGHFHYLHRIRQNYQTCLNLSVSWSGTDPSPWNLKQKQRINIHTKIFVKLREVREFLGWNKCGIHQRWFHELSLTTNLWIFSETEFVYLFLCTLKKVVLRWFHQNGRNPNVQLSVAYLGPLPTLNSH